MTKQNTNYTEGPIGRTMLKTGAAMLAGTLAMSGYNIVDTYFVGNLGRTPMAAMGFTMPVIMLVGCLFRGLTIGVMATLAQALGGKRMEKAALLTTSGMVLIMITSILFGIAGTFTSRPLFTLMNASKEALPQAAAYMNIWYLGCVTAFLDLTGNDLLIASGDSAKASALMAAGLVLNAILDPLFISGLGPVPAMGIRGAALATVASQGISAVAVLYLLYRKGLLVFRLPVWRKLKISWQLIVRFAIPASLGMLMMPIGSFFITWITAHFGDAAVAATAAAGRLEMLAFVFPMALGISLMPMVGQNFGGRFYSRIRKCRKFSFSFAFFFLLAMAVIYFFVADFLASRFSPDPEVQRIMVQCMRIIIWGFGAIEIHRFSGFFFTGCGYPSVAAWLNAFRILGLMLPLSFLALWMDSLQGLFWARLAADLIAGGTGAYLATRMTNHLPAEDGVPVNTKENMWYLVPAPLLRIFAQRQTDIDLKSGTQ